MYGVHFLFLSVNTKEEIANTVRIHFNQIISKMLQTRSDYTCLPFTCLPCLPCLHPTAAIAITANWYYLCIEALCSISQTAGQCQQNSPQGIVSRYIYCVSQKKFDSTSSLNL